jgi:hypothetical protein
MRKRSVAVTMALLGLALSASARGAEKLAATSAQADRPQTKISPAPELKQMDWFVATWKCTGKTFASPMEKENATESTLTIRSDLDGFWQSFTVDEAKTDENPAPVKVAGYGGYDSALKKFVRVGFNTRGRWSTWTSAGWKGDNLIFDGESGAKDVQLRQTITRKADNEFTSIVETKAAGKWVKAAEVSCKK